MNKEGRPDAGLRQTLLRLILLWSAAALLLYLALRGIPFAQVAGVLGSLSGGEIAVLAGLNLLILAIGTLRWWLVQRSLGWPVPLAALLAYRLAGFAVTYFTPGPQFGGEPLQVHLLQSRRGVPLQTAVASVFTDRLIDLLANFTFLAVGSAVIAFGGLIGGLASGGMWVLAMALLLLPVGHVIALRLGKRPATKLVNRLVQRSTRPAMAYAARVARDAEEMVAGLIREQPVLLGWLVCISGLGWALMVLEYHMMLYFLGASPRIAETISALTAARLAFLLPLPAGLGALEAAQALATGTLGWGAATGIAASLVIRARDVLLALLGLAIGGAMTHATLFGDRAKRVNGINRVSRVNRVNRVPEERSS